ncbi:hypothetical protein HRI_003549900 [Hibiscus trionum]|uniref:Peptidase metallopeptidase domain-containing protein n=1 Tax=Hibiscus trionum TaxID=183268 RepID=A0A9W7IN71_HIBTR|nr:hypothetical protein HRI_003549900 [Hibiscus trionum]
MAAKFSHQLYGAFLTFIVLQSFLVESRSIELESTQTHEQGQRRNNSSPVDIGRSNLNESSHLDAKYTFSGGRWYYFPLTYGFQSTSLMPSGLPPQVVLNVMDEAFRKWQAAVPEFAFQRVYPGENANIKISFTTTLTPDLYGYGYYPPDGSLNLDIGHTVWSTKSYPAYNEHDLLSGAMHEIGHTLGLTHSPNPNAVMYHTLDYGTIRRELSQEDIGHIQSLYYYG